MLSIRAKNELYTVFIQRDLVPVTILGSTKQFENDAKFASDVSQEFSK